MQCAVTAGKRQHGSRKPNAERRGEWSGPAVDSARRLAMIASSYEKPRDGTDKIAKERRDVRRPPLMRVVEPYRALCDCGAGEIETKSAADSIAEATSAESSSAR